ACAGIAGAFRLQGTIEQSCEHWTGTITYAHKRKVPFLAARSHCGDGIFDPGDDEACDGAGGTCGNGQGCGACRCQQAPVTTTTVTTTTLRSNGTSTTTTRSTTTTIPGHCGNGRIEADMGERCDPGASPTGCFVGTLCRPTGPGACTCTDRCP